MRFDHLGQLSIGTKPIGTTKYRLFCQKWSYFFVSITGYGIGMFSNRWTETWSQFLRLRIRIHSGVSIIFFIVIGLLTAAAAVEISHYPQPALLYLVPGVLIPLMTKSLIQVRTDD